MQLDKLKRIKEQRVDSKEILKFYKKVVKKVFYLQDKTKEC